MHFRNPEVYNTVMILAGDENIWNRLGVEGAALRPPRRVQGQSPPPSAEDKLHSEGPRLS